MVSTFKYKKRNRIKFELSPKILTHPNIPKPLHGLAPRVIFGETWWDKERHEVLRKYNYTCLVCGNNAKQDKFEKRWLHCHEYYKIDYKKLLVEFIKIVPLCYSCHMFIHSGRLNAIYEKNEIDIKEIQYILNRGVNILKKKNLTPFVVVIKTLNKLNGIKDKEVNKKYWKLEDLEIDNWKDWKLLLYGKYYMSKFKNYGEWEDFYS